MKHETSKWRFNGIFQRILQQYRAFYVRNMEISSDLNYSRSRTTMTDSIEKFQTQFVNCWSLSSNRVKFSIECGLIFSIQDNLSFFLCWEAVFPIISPNLAFKLLFSITYYWNCGAQQTESNELQIPSYLKWSVQWVPVCSSFSHLR